MGSNGAFFAAAAAVWLLFCCVAFAGRASAYYSVPADPRHPTWHPSPGPGSAPRGHYYHGPAASSPRQRRHHHRGVSAPAPAPPRYSASAPAPAAGADGLPSLPPPFVPVYSGAPEPPQQATTTTMPHFGFPLEPTVGVAAARPAGAPAGAGEGYPFIGSNPTVPLPTGVTDTATVLPLPDAGGGHAGGKVVGRAAAEPVRAPAAMIGLLVVLSSTVLLSSSSWSC